MIEEKTFKLGRGFTVEVSLRHVAGQPSWLGGPFKWAAKPIYSKKKVMPVGYNISQSGLSDNIADVKLSIASSTMSWFAKTIGKTPRQIKHDKRFTTFLSDFMEWVDEVENEFGGVV